MDKTKKILHFCIETVVWLAIGVFFISTLTSFLANSKIIGNNHIFIVQSGSMEPSIMTGDIIVSSSQRIYKENDVVTFNDSLNGIVTHRIIEINQDNNEKKFITKGDANRVTDNDNISQSQIIGKVVFVLPRLGYLVVFSRQPLGAILLIGIPGIVIIFEEIIKLKNKKNSREKI